MNKHFGTALVAAALIGLSACSGSENAAANTADANVIAPVDTGIDNNVNTSDAELEALANDTTPIDNAAGANTLEPAGNAL